MSQILEVYKDMLDSGQRFVDEVFQDDSYGAAVPQLTIIDAGAYEGEFSFYCYNFAKKIYAFEPDPRPFGVLRDRLGGFSLGKIEAHNAALANEDGARVLHASGAGGSKLLEDGAVKNKSNQDIPVEAIGLADFILKNDLWVDILKIDIEDGEAEIFNGPRFPEVAERIKLIIGEHLGGSHAALLQHGFTQDDSVHASNAVYRRQ